ncbi:hypothetical protein GLP40_20855 [Nocardia sp. CT2-14]|uniref:Imm-5-like domain-containing protein n=1 Tax=Nocardia aurantiaca TaxID=2675850 RepID=A0A6I3L3Q3_9NOCA|nr:hypothetical protein [Nocardia aurantiaca]
MEPNEVALSDEDRRLVTQWAAECAERGLSLFEAKAPFDTRPRAAIEAARVFALKGTRTARLRSLAWAAFAAAHEVDDQVASAAARAANLAAAAPFTHAVGTTHQSGHLLGPAVHQAQARELAAGNDSHIGDAEVRWAIEHAPPAVHEIVRRFPPYRPDGTRLGELFYQLDAGLRR